MKYLVIAFLLAASVAWGAEKTLEEIREEVAQELREVEDTVKIHEITSITMTGPDGRSATVDFGGEVVEYSGDLPVSESAMLFFCHVFEYYKGVDPEHCMKATRVKRVGKWKGGGEGRAVR